MESLQKCCCGTGGDYNFDFVKFCGRSGVPVCEDPSQRLSWDGVHFTQAAYKVMASWLINDILPQLQRFQSSYKNSMLRATSPEGKLLKAP
ncbi:hypothetical protein LguiB_006537 [Lonicera macranthoides]